MDLPFMSFYYPSIPLQFDQSQTQWSSDSMPPQHTYHPGFYYPQPTYIPVVQPMVLPKPATDNKPLSYNKNELRSSIFAQILDTFPELNNLIGTSQNKDKPACMYEQQSSSVRYSERRPYETNLASDIMREEFDDSFVSSPPIPQSTITPYDQVSDLLEHAISSASSRVTKPKKQKEHIECPVCQKTFSSKPNLKVHFQQHQENKRPHQCQHCGKRFTQRSTLRTHIRTHTGERPYKCSHCPKSFSDFSTFTKHSRIHSGERPYVCPICGKGFAQSGNMIRHKEVHNNSS